MHCLKEQLNRSLQNIRDTVGGHYDAVLDTIGMQETEALGINSLKKGGHYMTLQVCGNTHL